MRRYCCRPFPEYAHRPGRTIHPNKKGGHRFQAPEEKSLPINFESPFQNEDYLYALDLYHHGYYWESHVYWEAIWNAHHRQGEVADLMKGLIKLAAAQLKKEAGATRAMEGHLARAQELFRLVGRKYQVFCGIDLNCLQEKIEQQQFDELPIEGNFQIR